ncbi:MAG: gamma-glutamyltransferase [Synergistales bacterium]|nr:gamma-glutamyltransferase [Synergistales bacterium]
MSRRLSVFALSVAMAISATAAFGSVHDPKDVKASKGMVAAASALAAEAGSEILKKGGNAVDAAVATGLALNVVESNASGIGGGGFMVIRLADTGKVVAIDYREEAPAASTKDMYASEKAKTEKHSVYGPLAIGVPGTLAGYQMALEQYGTMTLAEVMQPALKLAEEGFVLAPTVAKAVEDNFENLSKYTKEEANPFLKDGLPIEAGQKVTQPNLAKAFRLIAKEGIGAFYNGPIGQSMVSNIQKQGGIMTMNDLQRYNPVLRVPAEGTYRGYRIFSMCPPSSGGITLVESLNILENFPLSDWGHNSPKTIHYMAEAFRMAFSDRGNFLGDPSFLNIPFGMLESKKYAKMLADRIDDGKAMKEVPATDPSVDEHWSTTHFSVADASGNIVSVTQTVNYFFGSCLMDPEYGFVYNNEMDDFSSDPKSVNAPEPGKRPLSSMSPTIVIDPNGKPFMSLGTPGAWRIITSVAQIMSNVIDFGMSMDEAIEAPRFTTRVLGTKPDVLQVESRIPEATVEALKLRGHEVKVRGDYDLYFGGAQGILFDSEKALLIGGADSRRDGDVVGY